MGCCIGGWVSGWVDDFVFGKGGLGVGWEWCGGEGEIRGVGWGVNRM